MKKTIIYAFACILLGSSCSRNEPISTSNEGNGFEVEFLFDKDGVKVYRFMDGGRYHYFTTLGETISNKDNSKDTYEENIK